MNVFLSMQRNNVSYFDFYYFRNSFSNEELNKIEEIASNLPIQTGTIGDSSDINSDRISDISWIEQSENTSWLYKKLAELGAHANKEMWNFDIWGYQDALQYTIYRGNGGHYDWHPDSGPGLSNRKLSCVLQLSDPSEYEGGELQIHSGNEKNTINVPKEKGLLCFFPSFLLHRVTPVYNGTRKSLVTWFSGANLR